MCVIAAIKLPRDKKTGEPTEDATWCLFKIRDRTYTPNYKIRTITKNSGISLFCVDDHTDWTEGIRVSTRGSHNTQLMMVNSALNNSVDKISTSSLNLANGVIARRIIRDSNIDKAIDEIVNTGFDGCTFLSNGKRCVVVEQSVKPESLKILNSDSGYKLTKDDFVQQINEIDSVFEVRTNHSECIPAGYTEDNNVQYESSTQRRRYIEEYINQNVHDIDDVYAMIRHFDNFDLEEPYNNPIRDFNKINWVKHKPKIYTTSVFIFYKNSIQIFLKQSNIRHSSLNVLNNDCFKICVERL